MVENILNKNKDEDADCWFLYENGNLAQEQRDEDLNLDGALDSKGYYDDGKLFKKEVDENFDGKFDKVIFYKKGKVERIEKYEYRVEEEEFMGF